MNIELFNNEKYILGEGPIYDYRFKTISWVDIVGESLYIKSENDIKKIKFNERIGAAIPIDGRNGYIVCGTTNLFLYENDEIKVLKSLDGITNGTNRCNDAKADEAGRLWFSIIVDDGIHKPKSSLYCYFNNEIKLMDDNLKLGNGMSWNKDNTKFYLNDSANHKIYVYDFDLKKGTISNKKVLCDMGIETPDGMTIDNKDKLFISIWDGGKIEVRNSETGSLIDEIIIPTKLVTSSIFIGDKMDTLLVTTAKLDRIDEYAGIIFKVKTNYIGLDINLVKI
ncbi:MAG: SMP-30/gluconolactonase/LRE family protein [bacterium]|nr:SMP-30/gluconolactonase/LRE family protein [bacterium]